MSEVTPPGETGASPVGAKATISRPESPYRLAQDLLFFAYRDFTHAADVILDSFGLGRAHHRALHFIGRHPDITVSELLSILRITKQSLARVLTELIDRGLVSQTQGRGDRRRRPLRLTHAGGALERRLFEGQRACLAPAFDAADPDTLAGFQAVMRGIMDESGRDWVDRGLAGANMKPRRTAVSAGSEGIE
jgi:DNA-binding MarR family transcriptional regulator